MTKRTRSRRAFTLIELMIALSAGTIAIASVYYLSGTANQTYNTQMRVAETQMSLRMAADQLRRTFVSAGYLAAPDSAGNGCDGVARSAHVFQAVAISPNESSFAAPIAALQGSNDGRLDTLTLVGNYATTEDYALSDATSGSVITFDTTKESFRRSFGTTQADWKTPFETAFAEGRMIRIEDGDGDVYFYDIASSDGGATPTVTTIQAPAACMSGARSKAAAAPVMQLRYRVVPIDGANTPAELQGLDSNLPGGQRMALMREEVSFADLSVIPGSERVVLDYVTEFEVNAVSDTTGNGSFLEIDDVSAPTLSMVDTTTLRALVLTLSARSPEVSRTVSHIGRIGPAMVTFQVGTDPSDPSYGVARVRTLRTETFLPNFLSPP
jgi:prepilin-type N-terminal cleavage/methylation domain-containing protein